MPPFRRSRGQASPDALEALGAFDVTLRLVEEAKTALLATVRTGRAQGIPLAEGVAAFEDGLHRAAASMGAWRSPPAESVRGACDAALRESLRRAERLRLEGSPRIYEELIAALDELIEPLEPFADASARLRSQARGAAPG